MVRRASLLILPLLLGACLTSTLPTAAPTVPVTAAPSASPAPSVEPSPSIEPSPSASADVSPSPAETAEPAPTPEAIQFEGAGNQMIGDVELPAATYAVTMKVSAAKGTTCSIDVYLIPDIGQDIRVGSVTSKQGQRTVKVNVPGDIYTLEVDDPGCTWSIDLAAQ